MEDKDGSKESPGRTGIYDKVLVQQMNYGCF